MLFSFRSFAFLAVGCACMPTTSAATFLFSNSNPSGLNGLANGSVTHPEVTVAFAVADNGAVFRTDAGRLGVDSRGIDASVIDPSTTRFNRLAGTAVGQFEGITFSFNQTGFLNDLYFDGMKDETLEHFKLVTPSGKIFSLFDFEAKKRLNDQNFELSDMGVPNPTLAEDSRDDVKGLRIPFRPSDIFTLTYGEIDYDGSVLPGYEPKDDDLMPTGDIPDGARFEGLSVTIIPEPATVALIAMLGALVVSTRTGHGCRNI